MNRFAYFSAGNGTGWKMIDVRQKIKELGYNEHGMYIWHWTEKFAEDICGQKPVIVTADPAKYDVCRLCGQDVVFIPAIMPPPNEPEEGYKDYKEFWGKASYCCSNLEDVA